MRTPLIAALCAAALLAGCIDDPYNEPSGARTPTPTPTATVPPGMVPPGPDDPPPPQPSVEPAALPSSPRALIERYVELTGTWDWRDAVARHRAAVPITIGSARTDVQEFAQQFSIDPRYEEQQITQRTTLEAVVPRGSADGGRRLHLIVLRRRIQTVALPNSDVWHVVLATLRPFDDRWAIEAWEEQV